jgi:hypothetical protein
MEKLPVRIRLAITLAAASIALVLVVGLVPGLGAQGIPYKGADISPVYEGWRTLKDGSLELMFGYFNRNQEEELDIPLGPDNHIEPGGPDQGQPTHFYPRRNRFVFHIIVPKDFGKKELVWTLTGNGRTNTVYATLHPDYYTDDIVIMNDSGAGGSGGGGYNINSNTPPVLKVEGDKTRTIAVGQPLRLSAVVTDDGIPKRRVVPLIAPWLEDKSKDRYERIGSRCCADSASGLRFSWMVFRGQAADVSFDPEQIVTWEDYRDGRNSPYSAGWEPPAPPPDNRWASTVTFTRPGTYVLRGVAHDGGLSTTDDVTVVVK